MGKTKIEWADFTLNPWIGCTKVSPACDHCYAETMAKRYGWAKWGPGETRIRTSDANWRKVLSWNRDAGAAGRRASVFCASLADWADAEVPDDWRRDLAAKVRETPHLDWLLLSKRHALIARFAEKYFAGCTNVRFGVTVENNDMAIIRLSRLSDVKRAGFKTFVSYEPALGPVDWERWIEIIDWLIAGGESGAKARPPHPDWFRIARDICRRFGIPFFLKQWGEWSPSDQHDPETCPEAKKGRDPIGIHTSGATDHSPFSAFARMYEPGWALTCRVGKKAAGALLDGREHRERPT